MISDPRVQNSQELRASYRGESIIASVHEAGTLLAVEVARKVPDFDAAFANVDTASGVGAGGSKSSDEGVEKLHFDNARVVFGKEDVVLD